MRVRTVIGMVVLIVAAAIAASAQKEAAVQMEKPGTIHAGGPIAFTVKLGEPMPKGARFDFRISPTSTDEEISLGSGEAVKGSESEFRVSGNLPDAAVPGEWHIAVVYFFLPGASWTHRTLGTNDLRFQVEGRTYPIPTKAEVVLTK